MQQCRLNAKKRRGSGTPGVLPIRRKAAQRTGSPADRSRASPGWPFGFESEALSTVNPLEDSTSADWLIPGRPGVTLIAAIGN